MTSSRDIAPTRIGLRAYDIAIGFRNLEERSAAIAHFDSTYTAGMAALLAGTIKGKDVIKDARALKEVAAEILHINPLVFNRVLFELAKLEMVRNIRQEGDEVISFTENVPLIYDNIHERLGISWLDKRPSELEEQFLVAIDTLARTPLLAESLRAEIGADFQTDQKLRNIGTRAELIQYHVLRDGTEVAVSPLHAFENPNLLVKLFERHPAELVREAFDRIRVQPGFPLLMNSSDPIIEDMVRLGLIPAPTVLGADHRERAFAILLYGLDPVYLTVKKQVLDRALALIACVRCGEVSGGVTPIYFPDRLLASLMDKNRNYTLSGHSSTPRQYAPLIRMGMIKTIPMGSYLGVRLEPRDDNLEAVQLARTLLRRQGVGLPVRGNEHEAAKLLFTDGKYLAPIETIARARWNLPPISQSEVENLWGKAFEWVL